MKRQASIVFMAFMALSTHAFAEPAKVLVCYTASSVDSKQAKPAIEQMVGTLEELAGFPKNSFASIFTDSWQACLDLIQKEKPHFVIPSLGLYLKMKDDMGLVPISQPRIKNKDYDIYRVVVKKGTFKDLEALKGKTLSGTVLEDVDFLERIVFRSKLDPSKHFVLKPSKVVLRTLRQLGEGKVDAVILTSQQFEALQGLDLAKEIEVIFESEKVPLPGVYALKSASAKEAEKFKEALSKFCSSSKGKGFCELFGIDGFYPVNEASYKAVEALWKKP
jgi:ABC-type amino acid transport substrate-binding protein